MVLIEYSNFDTNISTSFYRVSHFFNSFTHKFRNHFRRPYSQVVSISPMISFQRRGYTPFNDSLCVFDLSLSAEELLFALFDRDDDSLLFGASIVPVFTLRC
jgi:hypothetical protein